VAETIICLVGFLGYLLIKGDIFWGLAIATSIGAIIASPFAALTVRKINSEKLKIIISFATIALGVYTLLETFVF
jgi:uncharacterized membrane protein YfcA